METATQTAKDRELSQLLEKRKSLNKEIAKSAAALGYTVDANGCVLTGDCREMLRELLRPGGVFVEDAWKLETVDRDEYFLLISGAVINGGWEE
jgi:hypothetical protein